jgi:hypothetical protein
MRSAGVGFTLEKKFQGIFSGILSQLNAKKWKQSACCLTQKYLEENAKAVKNM